MSDDDITSDDANFKVNPPLRSRKDVEALRLGLKNDTIDVIATDHAPHHKTEKSLPLDEAPFGISGLETAVSLTITALVDTGYITPMQMAEKMSYNPAQIIGIDKGTLLPGKIADITIINPDIESIIDSNTFVSLGKNTPFNGKKVKGKVIATIVAGEVVYSAEAK